MKNYLFLIIFGLLFFNGYSQNEEISKKEKKNALAVSFGSPGFGIQYARKLGGHINLVAAYHFLSVENYEINDLDISGEPVNIIANIENAIIDLGFEYLPFKKSSFNLHAGIGILSETNLQALFTYTEGFDYGDINLSTDDIGEIDANVTWEGIAPYVGIGFGRAIPKKRLGLSLKMGSYITSEPTVNLTATNLLSNTSNQEENLTEAFSTFKFIPRVQLKLAYKF